jgi:hypothetical protein
MGPTIANCPQRILELLTTTTSENALEWRAKCWKRVNSLNAIPSLKKGVRFSLAAPMGFQNGDKVKDFVVLGSRGSRLMLADQRFPTDTRYRVPRTMLNQYVFAGKVTFNDSGLLAAPIEQTSAKPSLFK